MTIIVASNDVTKTFRVRSILKVSPVRLVSTYNSSIQLTEPRDFHPSMTPTNDDFGRIRLWIVSKNRRKSFGRNGAIRRYACVVATRVSIIARVGKEAEPVNLYRRRMQKGYISFLRADR